MANEFTRSRVYYTKAQIKNGLITKGGEWMTLDNVEYIGQYHRYTTGEVFTQPNWVDGKSRKLIPYVNINRLNALNDVKVDLTKNFEYDKIKKANVKQTKIPNQNVEAVGDSDLKNTYFERYFAYKRNDGRLLELSKSDYGKVGSKDGLNDVLWEKFKLKWKIKGVIHDTLDSMGNIKEAGVFDTNKRTVALYSEKYPTLKTKLMDFMEYYVPVG